MKKHLLILLFTTISTITFAQKTNFAGNWKLDKTRTNFAGQGEFVLPRYYKIEQQPTKIILTLTALTVEGKELTPVTDTLNFNGQVFQRKIAADKAVSSRMKWNEDQSLELTKNTPDLNLTETWTLEDGGKTLVLKRHMEQVEDGTKLDIKGYYTKQ